MPSGLKTKGRAAGRRNPCFSTLPTLQRKWGREREREDKTLRAGNHKSVQAGAGVHWLRRQRRLRVRKDGYVVYGGWRKLSSRRNKRGLPSHTREAQ